MSFKEADMYAPLKAFFEGLGYDVRGEVKGIDMALVKENSLTAVEMKKNFNATLLFQALDRQRLAAEVYVAIPLAAFLKNKRHIRHILERMGLGLVTVDMKKPEQAVEKQLAPNTAKARNNKASRAVMAEFGGRSFDENVGGAAGAKLVTAHKERSLQIACALERLGTASPALLRRDFDCHVTTGQILQKNVLGWFERVEKGKYALSWQGHEALDEPLFSRLVALYRKKLESDENVQSQEG